MFCVQSPHHEHSTSVPHSFVLRPSVFVSGVNQEDLRGRQLLHYFLLSVFVLVLTRWVTCLQVLCKEDLAALKCRLQKIKKQVEAVPPAASSSVTPADVHNLQARLVLAKQLSAKVQKSAESEEKPGDALTQDR